MWIFVWLFYDCTKQNKNLRLPFYVTCNFLCYSLTYFYDFTQYYIQYNEITMLCESLCDFFYDFTQYKLKKDILSSQYKKWAYHFY